MCSVAYVVSILTLVGSTAFVTTVRDSITSQHKVQDPCAASDLLPEVVIDDNRSKFAGSEVSHIDVSSLMNQGYLDVESKFLTAVKNDLNPFKGFAKGTKLQSLPTCPNCMLKVPSFARTNKSCEVAGSDECSQNPDYNCTVGFCSNTSGMGCQNVTKSKVDSIRPGLGGYQMLEIHCCCSDRNIGFHNYRTVQKVMLNYPTDIPLS